MDWDTTIALAYAAEQLFIAAQALSSDLVSPQRGLRTADGYLQLLLENERFLPSHIRKRLRHLHAAYLKNCSALVSEAAARTLARKTMSLLEEIRSALATAQPPRQVA